MLVLNAAETEACLDYAGLVDVMKSAMIDKYRLNVFNPPRRVYQLAHDKAFGLMTCYSENARAFGGKLVSVFPSEEKNASRARHQGFVALFNYESGALEALVNGEEITAKRTAAVSAAATRILAKSNSKVLAICGAGRQAIEHIKVLKKFYEFSVIQVYSRSHEAFTELQSQMNNFTLEYFSCPQDAVRDADIVCLCTSSKESYLKVEDFKDGAHINAIGACRPGMQEIDMTDSHAASIYYDDKNSLLLEADEVRIPLKQKRLDGSAVIGEIGALLDAGYFSRKSEGQITLYKSLGLAIQDIYAAGYAVSQAREHGMGCHVNF